MKMRQIGRKQRPTLQQNSPLAFFLMSFKYQSDRGYYVIAKHSGTALAVNGNNARLGAAIEHQPLGMTREGQQVRFQAAGQNEYYMLVRVSNLAVTVHAGMKEAHAPIVQWSNDGVAHQRWRPMHWADGYYHLISVNSGLALEIPGATGGPAQLQQNTLQPGASHQLFRIEQVVVDKLPSPVTFKKHSDLLRDATLGATGLIPKVGGGLKAVLGVLWPDQHDQDFWNQMTAYVDERIRSAVEQVLLDDMKLTLEGARTNIIYFNRLADPHERSIKLTSILTDLIGKQGKYLRKQDKDQTWISIKVLPYLVGYGTLLLCAQAERVRSHSQLFPHQTDADRKVQIDILQEELALFNDAVAAARTQALQDRLSLVVKGRTSQTVNYNTNTFYTVDDKFDNWHAERVHSQNRAGSYHDAEAEAHAHTMYLARRAQVTEQFNAELDALLAPARVWRFLDPAVTERPGSEKVRRAVGPYGGVAAPGKTSFDVHVARRLTKLKFYRSNDGQPYIVGMVQHYSDGVSRHQGRMTDRVDELQLDSDEYFTNVYGRASDFIHSLTFDTNKGRRLRCQPDYSGWYSVEFVAGVDDGLPTAQLVGIAGTATDDRLISLTFHWEYEWKYDWAAAALRATAPEPEELLATAEPEESLATEG